jgi:CheY-like chemotaxis protein
LVDDERESRALLTAFLSLEGVQAVAVADVLEALMALESESFDLVIADLGLPGASGYDLLRAVRRRPGPMQEIPIIAVTGRSTHEDRDRVLGAGFRAHVAKPVDLQSLLLTIRTAAGRPPPHPPDAGAWHATGA